MPPSTDQRNAAAIDELRSLLGRRLARNDAIREHHARDESWHPAHRPDAVCFPTSTDEVSKILAICSAHHVPVTPFGTGTGLEGGSIAWTGGICVDVSGMNSILSVSEEDMDCNVEPGVTREQLNRSLRASGLFFPVDPGADASLGGMAATRASGTTTVRYGTMRENILAMEVVLADGSVVATGSRARKSSAGYDLTHLFTGSEGTLGIITRLTLRLHGRPAAISAARVYFDDIEGAVQSAIYMIQSGIGVARVELLDAAQMAAINRYSGTSYPEQVALFLEFHGSESSVREQAEASGEICSELGGSEFEWTVHEEQRRKMWNARHSAAYAAMAMRPTAKAYATDVCVPISRLADCIRETRRDVAETTRMPTFLLGHIGDGNFHYVFLVDPHAARECEEIRQLSERLVERAIRMGGTCTGEHGIGIGKRKYLEKELGSGSVTLMRTIKDAIDPFGIMNPGKVLPPLFPESGPKR